jgi:hypothetical protein
LHDVNGRLGRVLQPDVRAAGRQCNHARRPVPMRTQNRLRDISKQTSTQVTPPVTPGQSTLHTGCHTQQK